VIAAKRSPDQCLSGAKLLLFSLFLISIFSQFFFQFTPPDSPSPTSTTIAFDDHSIFNSSLNNNQQPSQQLTTTSTSFNNQNNSQFGTSRHSSFGSSTSSNNAAALLPSFSSPPKTTLKKSPLSFIPTNSTPQNQLIDSLKLNHLAMSRSKNNDKRIPIYKRNNNAGTTTNIGGGRSLSFIESFMKSEAGTKKGLWNVFLIQRFFKKRKFSEKILWKNFLKNILQILSLFLIFKIQILFFWSEK